MNCTNCGSARPASTGYCGTCGQPTSSPLPHAEPYPPPAMPAQPTMPALAAMPMMPAPPAMPMMPPSPYGPSAPLPYGPPAGYGQASGPPPVQPYPGQPLPYGPGPHQPYQAGYPYAPVLQKPSNRLSIIAFILAGVALFILPVVFGVAGIAVGAAAKRREERLGKASMIVAIVATLLGMIAGAIVRMRLLR